MEFVLGDYILYSHDLSDLLECKGLKRVTNKEESKKRKKLIVKTYANQESVSDIVLIICFGFGL